MFSFWFLKYILLQYKCFVLKKEASKDHVPCGRPSLPPFLSWVGILFDMILTFVNITGLFVLVLSIHSVKIQLQCDVINAL